MLEVDAASADRAAAERSGRLRRRDVDRDAAGRPARACRWSTSTWRASSGPGPSTAAPFPSLGTPTRSPSCSRPPSTRVGVVAGQAEMLEALGARPGATDAVCDLLESCPARGSPALSTLACVHGHQSRRQAASGRTSSTGPSPGALPPRPGLHLRSRQWRGSSRRTRRWRRGQSVIEIGCAPAKWLLFYAERFGARSPASSTARRAPRCRARTSMPRARRDDLRGRLLRARARAPRPGALARLHRALRRSRGGLRPPRRVRRPRRTAWRSGFRTCAG